MSLSNLCTVDNNRIYILLLHNFREEILAERDTCGGLKCSLCDQYACNKRGPREVLGKCFTGSSPTRKYYLTLIILETEDLVPYN